MWSLIAVLHLIAFKSSLGHLATKRLYDDLLIDYNRLIRPVNNHSSKLVVNLSLKFTQLIDINMKQQVMSTNVWVGQSWYDYKLTWNPAAYEGVDMIHVPAEHIWQPDIVLFNNADGNYEVTSMTKALVHHTGEVVWKPPAMYKSTCEIDVEWFPFDVQSCLLKFGSWTYDGNEVDLRHVDQEENSVDVAVGVDMSEFYKSVEWDILLVPAKYSNEYFDCCPEPYPHITFNVTMRRKTLFYTVNLIIPVVGISFLTLLVFYLPSDSGEKVTLSISILVCLTLFFLLLAEIIPPTSLAVPLLGKYLLFTMILVTLSICVTVGVLNVHFRSPSTHKMAPWVRTLFIHLMPRLLLMKRPSSHDLVEELASASKPNKDIRTCNSGSNELNFRRNAYRNGYKGFRSAMDTDDIPGLPFPSMVDPILEAELGISPFIQNTFNNANQIHWSNMKANIDHSYQCNPTPQMQMQSEAYAAYSPEVQKAVESILFIAEHLRKEDEENNVIEDWKYVAMVLDRLFLWIFTVACVVGTCGIILQAPSLYDETIPIDSQLSQIGRIGE